VRAAAESEVGIDGAATGLIELDAVNIDLHGGDGPCHGRAAFYVY
jgi:hypothetical protein